MSIGSSQSSVSVIPEWQQANDSVPEGKLYNHLLRLAILAYQIEVRAKETPASSTSGHKRSASNVALQPSFSSKLPKGVLKALKLRFKALATEEGADANDHLRRSYLSFYAQILYAKANEPDLYQEMKFKAEVLIVRFLSCVNKEMQKSLPPGTNATEMINEQGAAFVELLLQAIRQVKPNQQLISQLESYKASLQPSHLITSNKSSTSLSSSFTVNQLSYSLNDMDLARQVGKIMQISDSIVQQDIIQLKNTVSPSSVRAELNELISNLRSDQHPMYYNKDFDTPEAWLDWQAQEEKAIEQLIAATNNTEPENHQNHSKIIPASPKSYSYATVRRCLDLDASSSVLLSSQSRKLLAFAAQYWRISPETQASLLLHALASKYRDTKEPSVDIVNDTFNLMKHLTQDSHPDTWPISDYLLVSQDLADMRQSTINHLAEILSQLFAEKVPKMGPLLQILDEHLLTYIPSGILDSQFALLKRKIVSSAEKEYDALLAKIPRDESLDLIHIVELGDSIISVAKKLQKRYTKPLLEQLPIAMIVCARQIKLFSNDFLPMFNYCVGIQEEKGESPDFEEVSSLYKTLAELKGLYQQVSVAEDFEFNIEELFYPYVLNWARSSSELAKSWVMPALEQDTFLPIDTDILYSTSVKDIFSSFYSSIQAIEDLQWENHYHLANVLTLLVQGFGDALNTWTHRIRNDFFQDFDTKAPKQQFQSRQERWLAMARAAVQQQTVTAPEPIHFRVETCVRLNDIEAAYDMLYKMEETLDADAISKRIELERKRDRNANQDMSKYLYTINIRSALDLKIRDSKGSIDPYVTLIDEAARKKIGRTRTVYESPNPTWNQKFEMETTSRVQIIKIMVWDENANTNHDLSGTTRIKLDPKEFGRTDYGSLHKILILEQPMKTTTTQTFDSKIIVQVTMDKESDDIRFYFGKALRFLKQSKQDMIELVVEQFSSFIKAYISLTTVQSLLSNNRFSMDTLSSWLGRPVETKAPLTKEQVADSLQPLFDYLNSNFSILAGSLTPALKLEVMSQTWSVVLETIESLILPPLDRGRTIQNQLSSSEMEIVFIWLSTLREFFHNDGAGPSLESLQSSAYQKIMTIPVYYDLTTPQLRSESEKLIKTSLRTNTQRAELLQRQGTVMAHRNRKVIEKQAAEVRDAQRAAPQIDDVILRILRMRNDHIFIDRHLDYRNRIEMKLTTEKALQGL